MTPVRSARALLFVTLAGVPLSSALSTGCEKPPPPPEEDAGPDPNQCVVDVNFNMLTADPITPGTDVTGTLCPTRDRDLYSFAVANAGEVALVHLKMSTFLTAVEPAYSILKEDGSADGLPTGFFAADGQKSAGEAVDFVGATASRRRARSPSWWPMSPRAIARSTT